jgi:hypothetical protein
MVSLEKAKQILKDKGYSDAKIQEIQETLYKLADVLINKYLAEKSIDNNRD